MDLKDEQIMTILLENSRLSHREIARATHIPLTTVHNRIKKLLRDGIIRKYTIDVDYDKLGYTVGAYILVTVAQNPALGKDISQQKICKLVKKISGVEEAHIVTGQTDVVLKIRAKNIPQLNKLLTKDLRNIEGVDRTVSLIILE